MGLRSQDPVEPSVDFDRDIRPILSDRCYFCHGPDSGQRQADLRLDLEDEAMNVITPGDPDDSELIRRIFADDPDERMPPPDSKLEVTPQERELIKKWVMQGAKWKKHWAFERPVKQDVPSIKSNDNLTTEIDRFIVAKLEANGLELSPAASQERLIRRVTFDLTGLPPKLEEIDDFLNDDSPAAYEKVVDRLLQSNHYGERMASDWLDVARYSDTFGYQVDRDRYVWPWRDWVIRAFNANKSYDQFLTEQLAGDLLPDATDDQILATTFNRLHPQKVEGGSVEEEFRVEYVADRTQTLATAFLGLTLECARCHDHKFDPISQKEYYQLFSFFNNIDEAGLYSYFTESVPTPTMRLVNAEEKQRLIVLEREAKQLAVVSAAAMETFQRGFEEWLDQTNANSNNDSLAIEFTAPLETVDFATIDVGQNKIVKGPDGVSAVQLTGDDEVKLKTGNFTRYQPFSIACSINTPDEKDRAVIFHRSRAWTDAGSRGYQLLIEDGKLSASLIHFWPGNAMRVRTIEKIPVGKWLDIAVVYDGSTSASGLQIFVDGKRQLVEIVRDNLTKNITGGGGDEITIGARFRDRGFTNGMLCSMHVYDREISPLEVAALHDPQVLNELKSSLESEGGLSDAQTDLLRQHYLLNESKSYSEHRQQRQKAIEAWCQALDAATEIMVMKELPTPRTAFVLQRGLYNNRLAEVTADTPSVFPKLDPQLPRNRLGLAKWLTNPKHPLTARVAVNHYWQMIFGDGLVRTPEDFGRQGKPPTHPELLDWLAVDFVEHGWDVKRLLKQLVMSQTYRQSSDVTKELLQRDPENEWLARFPSYRWPAEMLRDNVLAVSGLLVDKMGGPPARPYELAASFKPSTPDEGDGLYRRSLYTYWKRTGPAPVMMTLDAAKRDVCRVKRERTSTPLQALVMLNGPQFVEAARALTSKLIEQHGVDSHDAILNDMFRSLTSRLPTEPEREIIQTLFEKQLNYFRGDSTATQQYLATGKFGNQSTQTISPPANHHDLQGSTDTVDPAVLAAWSSVANTLFNLDECVTKR